MQEPTNSEILRAVEAIDRKFTPMIEGLDKRLQGNEKYINDQIAVADYVAKNGTNEQKALVPQPVTTDENAKPDKLAKTIGTMFAFFSAVIALITYIIQLAFNK